MKKLTVFCLILALLCCGCAEKAPQQTAAPVQATAPAGTDAPTETTAPTEETLTPAPDFTVYDEAGNAVKLSDFAGTPVVLNFWASWCGPCKSEMPEFDATCKALQGKVQFMMVDLTDGVSETVESGSGFIADAGYTFPVFYDTDMDAAYTYGIQSIPTTFFINTRGELVAYYTGAMSQEILDQGISLIYTE